MSVIGLAAAAPLLAVFGYRRSGVTWMRAAALGALAAVLATVGWIAFGLLYDFAISIESGLCGRTPAVAIATGTGVFVLVGSWASLRPVRVWAWPLAAGAALAAVTAVAYFYASAHHYCET